MREPQIISICSDYGHASEGVGLMHGAVLRVTRDVQIVDLTHEIESFDTADGARALESVWWMPVGIHVCVVDPGVGSERRAIAIQTMRGDILIGPDNGVLLPAATKLGGIAQCFEIANRDLMMQPVSATFHGRDVFASCAGWLAHGVPLQKVGPQLQVSELAEPAFVEAKADAHGVVQSRVIHINRYGTATLNFTTDAVRALGVEYGNQIVVRANSHTLQLPFVRTFSDVKSGEPMTLPDPYERLALAVNKGYFSREFGLGLGTEVQLWAV